MGEGSLNAPPKNLEADVIDGFAGLLDLTCDIERNQIDSAFKSGGGEIIYIYDENIFETFCAPGTNNYGVNSFHSRNWLDANSRAKLPPGIMPRWWHRVRAETALIAAEYAIAGDLQRNSGNRLYMTPWHRKELLNRVGAIAADLDTGEAQTRARDVDVDVVLSGLAHGQSEFPDAGPTERRVQENALKDADGVLDQENEAEVARYLHNRIAARLLAWGTQNVGLCQLRRLLRPPLLDRFRTLNADFEFSKGDLATIAADADKWMERMVAHKNAIGSERSPASLWADAQGLAMVRLLVRRYMDSPTRRIVLVTGDGLMFEAYRRWFVNVTQDQEEEFYEPFFLRRIGQYAPIFNLYDSDTDVGRKLARERARELFAKVQQSVELALLPLNLSITMLSKASKVPANVRRLQLVRGREYIAHMGASDPEGLRKLLTTYFLRGRTDQWVEEQAERQGDLADRWRTMERLAIGFSSEVINRRLSSLAPDKAEEEELAHEASTETVAEGFEAQATLALESLNLSLPFAKEIIEQALKESDNSAIRLPSTVWYKDRSGNRIWEQVGTAEGTSRVLETMGRRKHREDTFAAVSAISLRRGNWEDAERFAEITCTSIRGRRAADPDRARALLEANFMLALTRRLQSGQLGGHLNAGGQNSNVTSASLRTLSRDVEAAKATLDECLTLVPKGVPANEALLEEMRIRSERAAILLFRAASRLCAKPEGIAARLMDQIQRDADLARDDLAACAEAAERIEALGPGQRERDFEVVRRQYLCNTAAHYVIIWTARKLHNTAKHLALTEAPQQIAAQIRALRDSDWFSAAPGIVRYELDAFAYATETAPKPTIPDKQALSLLRLDFALAKEIERALKI